MDIDLVYVGYERACVLQYKQDVFGHIACIVNQPAQLHMYVFLLRNPTAIFRCCPPCSWPLSSIQGVHISQLPADVLRLILTWVVSEDLDLLSLERFSAVSDPLFPVNS